MDTVTWTWFTQTAKESTVSGGHKCRKIYVCRTFFFKENKDEEEEEEDVEKGEC